MQLLGSRSGSYSGAGSQTWKMNALGVAVGIILTGCLSATASGQNLQVPIEVEQWRRTEIALTSDSDYPNPFADVTVTATFRNGETTITRPAFWDGDRMWRVRFAPPAPGKWHWQTTCSEQDNKGLHGLRGTLTCTSYGGDNPNYVHGFVRVSPNRRYFVRADGTPFFWLGDTHWMMADHERLDANNAPDANGKDQFTQLVEDRLGKGFTVYQNYFAGHHNHWWRNSEYACIDPARFRQVMDPMLDQLADRGFVIAQGIGALQHVRYGAARIAGPACRVCRSSLWRTPPGLVHGTRGEPACPRRQAPADGPRRLAFRRGEVRSLQRLRASCQRAHVSRHADGLGTGALARLVRTARGTHQTRAFDRSRISVSTGTTFRASLSSRPRPCTKPIKCGPSRCH